jgi:Holliday junction resolvase
MKPEKVVQSDIIKWIKKNGGYCIKVIKGNENGIPDLIACVNGKFVGIEVKAEKYQDEPLKQASEWQKKQLKLIQQSDGIGMCVGSLEDFIDIISYYDFPLSET